MKEESFSDAIDKLIERKFDLKEYYGILKDKEVLSEIEKYSKDFRRSARIRI